MDQQNFTLELKLNGKQVSFLIDTRETLLDVLRDRVNLTGPKKGCDESACGACAVFFNGYAVCSCTMLAAEASGGSVVTIESLSGDKADHPIQKEFIENDAFQCGFCTSGQIISALSLISHSSGDLSAPEIKEGMSGNVCRCGAYVKIVQAVSGAIKGENPL